MTQIHSQHNYQRIQHIEHTLSQYMALWGYETMTLPIIEPATIFLTRAGNDIISKLFTFERHSVQLALRPEFTAAAAYHYAQSAYTTAKRWQFSGPIFEDDPQDASLQYQTHSIGAELIGQSGVMADTEVISMAATGIKKLNIQNWQIVTGHVGLQQHLLAQFGLDSRIERLVLAQRDVLKQSINGKKLAQQSLDQTLTMMNSEAMDNSDSSYTTSNGSTERMLDVLLDSTRHGTTMGGRSRQDIARRLLHKHERNLNRDRMLDALNFFAQWVAIEDMPVDEGFAQIQLFLETDDTTGQQLLSDWRTTVALLEEYGITKEQVRIQANLTRNWEYYTGVVFGVQSKQTGDFIAGGGRYDELTHLLSGEKNSPAVGFVYYIAPLLNVLPSPETRASQITLSAQPEARSYAIRWANVLRTRQITVVIATEASADSMPVDSDGLLTYQENTYSLDRIDDLIQTLKVTQA